MTIYTESKKIEVSVDLHSPLSRGGDITAAWDDISPEMTDAEAAELHNWIVSTIKEREEVQAQTAKEAAADPDNADIIWRNATDRDGEGIPYLNEGEEYWWSWDEKPINA